MLILFACIAQLTTAAPVQRPEVVDLTHLFGNDTIYWPGLPGFKLGSLASGPAGDIPWLAMNNYSAPEHGGTHMDAPVHFSQGKWSVSDIHADRLVAPALVVDIRDKTAVDDDYELTVQDLQDWEQRHGRIEDGCVLLILTGWHRYYSNRTRYLGNANNDPQDLHFPGISADAARWLVANRSPYGVGLDTPSLDHGPSQTFPTHQVLYAENIYGLENVAKLDQLNARGAMLYVAVMKIDQGSGGPVRLLATLNNNMVCSAQFSVVSLLLLALCLVCRCI